MAYLEEIRSDLSRFHRVDELESLPADRFFSLVHRLQFYDGAVRWHALHPPAPELSDEDALIAHAGAHHPASNFAPGSYTVVQGVSDG